MAGNLIDNSAAFLAELERAKSRALETIGQQAEKKLLPMQDGDVKATYADTSLLNEWVGFSPSTPIQEGVNRFVTWYRDYYKV